MGLGESVDMTIKRRKAKLSTNVGKCTTPKSPKKGVA
jgi:hypothetical protein